MNRIALIISLVLTSYTLIGQNAEDALRYSNTFLGGDARFVSMGGAFGALGANISSMSYNPAGIAVYNSSIASFSIGKLNNHTNSVYNGISSSDDKKKLVINNGGLIITDDYLNIEPQGKWKRFQFGISVNQLKNFNRNLIIQGENSVNSIADMYSDIANGIDSEDIENDYYGNYAFDLNLAWWSYLINTTSNNSTYGNAAPTGGALQRQVLQSNGSLNELNFAFGGNMNDKLYLGASIGIPYFNYSAYSTYTESALESNIPDSSFRSLSITDDLNSTGAGINLKLGVIYRANNWLRLGLALHTPTFWSDMQDQWSSDIKTSWDEYDDEYERSPQGEFFYEMLTPFKAIGSAAIIVGPYGLISADYEFIDYSMARLYSMDYDFIQENQDIEDFYQASSNLKIGTEWRYNRFSIRGGYCIYGNPVKDNNTGAINAITYGFGYSFSRINLDFAWSHLKVENDYYLYGSNNVSVNPATIKESITNFIVTLAVRF